MSLRDDIALRIPPRGEAVGAMILIGVLLAGCTAIGPPTLARDRFDYVSAISDSWKRQTLLNLVKTRYLDAPVFMDVASVINQYALEQEVGVGLSGEFYNRSDPSSVSPEIGVSGRYTDRPTITYNPLMGEHYARSLLKPIPNAAILLLVEAGYPIDHVLRVCVQTINGLDNRMSGRFAMRDVDPAFFERCRDEKSICARAQRPAAAGRQIRCAEVHGRQGAGGISCDDQTGRIGL